MGRVVVISNPVSGRNKRDRGLSGRLRALVPDPADFLEPTDPAAIEEVARTLLAAGDIDVLCVNGGDGTLAHVLSAFARQGGERPMPLVGILRGGTMNTVAHGIGLSGRPERILARILARHGRGEDHPTVSRFLMRIQDGLGPDRYGFIFGNGVISNFLEAYYEGGDASPWKAVRVLTRAILSALVRGRFAARLVAPLRARVSLDGQPWAPTRYLSVAAATVDDLGLGFRPFWGVLSKPGRLQALGFACSAPVLAWRIPRTWFARPWNHPDIQDQLGQRLVIEGQEPLAYMIEGDFHPGGTRLVVEVGPELRLIRG